MSAEFGKVLGSLHRTFDAVLEVGALPDERSLLLLPVLDRAAQRVGINLMEEGVMGSVRVLRGDARRLSFADASFDLVLSNSTLEHIPNFWLACEEMKRVLKPGGVMVVSVPGYVQKTMVLSQLQRWSRRMRGLQEFRRTTLTFGVHDHPHDYYRFSEQAVRTVVLDGLNEIRVWPVMTPPRLFGMGFKPSS